MVTLTLAFMAGMAVAAPPAGPLTLLFYRHAMVRDFRAAAALATVIALADGMYAAISMYGYPLLLGAPRGLVLVMRCVGVLLLLGLGLRYIIAPPVGVRAGRPSQRVGPVFAQGMGIAFFNPSALITWIVLADVVRTTFGWGGDLTAVQKLLLPLGVSAGVATWFLGVLTLWRHFVRPPSARRARLVVRVVGMVLVTTALVYGWQAVHPASDALRRTTLDSAAW